jgi:hypothetical protein
MASKRDATLEAMIEEATVDAYDDDEQLTGLFSMLEEHLVVPFTTTVLGVEVTVKKSTSPATASSPSAPEAGTGSGSTCSTCHCLPRHRTARTGSTPTGTGLDGRSR